MYQLIVFMVIQKRRKEQEVTILTFEIIWAEDPVRGPDYYCYVKESSASARPKASHPSDKLVGKLDQFCLVAGEVSLLYPEVNSAGKQKMTCTITEELVSGLGTLVEAFCNLWDKKVIAYSSREQTSVPAL